MPTSSIGGASRGLLSVRALSWAPTKFNLRPSSPGALNDSDAHEEVAKAAVLEAIKGRQQTDLMLRCESVTLLFRKLTHFHNPLQHHIGTVLDAEGTPSDHHS